jgi:hypothetical protein
MELKDIATVLLSLLALGLSIYATYTSQKERTRTIRAQLTDVLGKLTTLSLDRAKFQHDAKDDQQYLDSVNAALGQQNGFLLDQAVFLSEQIPELVTTYEFNTIAVADSDAGNIFRAEVHQLKAIDAAKTDLYKSQAIRGYAVFLFPQGRLSEGREQYRKAIEVLKGESNLVHWTNGMTYQMWAFSELNFARSPERANQYVESARKEYSAIDVEFMRNRAIAALEAFRSGAQPAAPIPGQPFERVAAFDSPTGHPG